MNFSELKQIVEDAGYSPRSYSGRGMHGRKCLSVNLDRDESELDMMLDIAESIQAYVETEDEGLELEDVTAYFKGAKSDSMGLGSVIYFPDIDWEEFEDIDNDDFDDDEDE